MDSFGEAVRDVDGGIEAALHVQPRARRCEIAGVFNGALKLKVAAPPVDDAANRAVIEFIAGRLEIPKSRIRIVRGAKSRNKILRIDGIRSRYFLDRIQDA